VTDINIETQKLEEGKTYKYRGIEETEGIQHQKIKKILKKEYSRRLRMILKSKLHAKNKLQQLEHQPSQY
jgi:hypothetical protein